MSRTYGSTNKPKRPAIVETPKPVEVETPAEVNVETPQEVEVESSVETIETPAEPKKVVKDNAEVIKILKESPTAKLCQMDNGTTTWIELSYFE